MNQHDNPKTRIAKQETTQALKSEIVAKAQQEAVKMSDDVVSSVRETLFKAENRKVVVEQIIMSFQAEMNDLLKVIQASEASLSILEEKNRPQFTSIEGGAV